MTEHASRKIVTLSLPYPISANRYWRTYMPKGFKAPVTTLSAEAKAYKHGVATIAHAAGIRAPIIGRVSVNFALYPNRPQDWAKRAEKNPDSWDDDVQCIDLDNAQKVVMDSLKNILFQDDRWVRHIEAHRMEPDGKARLVVTVRDIITQRAQPALFDVA